jgi:hypothetical protein
MNIDEPPWNQVNRPNDLIVSLRQNWATLPEQVIARVKALRIARRRGRRAGKAHRQVGKHRPIKSADLATIQTSDKDLLVFSAHTVNFTAPSLYVFNAAALTKPHAIDHLAADLTSYQTDVG